MVEIFRLSQDSHKRLEIGTGTVAMNLDQVLEERISFWTDIWEQIRPIQRFESSPTWSDPMLHRLKKNQQKMSRETGDL